MLLLSFLEYCLGITYALLSFNWLCLQVKSLFNPCKDENEDIQDDEVSLGANSVQIFAKIGC